MFIRLSININSSIIPFYMELVLGFEKTKEGGKNYEIIICLLSSTLGSIFNSLFVQNLLEAKSNSKNKRIILISIPSIFEGSGYIPFFFPTESSASKIYFLAFIWGIGFSQAFLR